jgi:hypothetical protein
MYRSGPASGLELSCLAGESNPGKTLRPASRQDNKRRGLSTRSRFRMKKPAAGRALERSAGSGPSRVASAALCSRAPVSAVTSESGWVARCPPASLSAARPARHLRSVDAPDPFVDLELTPPAIPLRWRGRRLAMDTEMLLGACAALLLLVYLISSVLFPEKL